MVSLKTKHPLGFPAVQKPQERVSEALHRLLLESAVSSGDSSRVRDCHPPGMGTLYRYRPMGPPSHPQGQKKPGKAQGSACLALGLSSQKRDWIDRISTKQSLTAAGPRCRPSWEGGSVVPTLDHALGCTSITSPAQLRARQHAQGGTSSPEPPVANTCLLGLE